jgi:transcription initiation factor TFIID subunit 12
MDNRNQAPQASAGRPPYSNLIKIDQMTKIGNILPPENRAKLFSAVQQNWAIIESQPADSPAHKRAFQQLYSITEKISTLTKQRQMGQQSQIQLQQAGGQSAGQTQQMQIAGVRPNQGAQAGQAQMEQKAGIKSEAQSQLQQQLQGIENFPYTYPRTSPSGTPQGEKWLTETKASLRMLVNTVIKFGTMEKQLLAQAAKDQQAGNMQQVEFHQKKAQEARAEWEGAQRKMQAFRMNQAKMKQEMEKTAGQGIMSEVKVEDTKSQAVTAPSRMGAGQQTASTSAQKQQQQPTATSTASTAASTMAQPPPSNPAMQSQAQAQRSQAAHSPVSSTLPQHPQSQSATSFPRPQQAVQQPARPSLNTQQPLGSGIPSASSGSATSSQPVPLSHNAAIDAARSYSEQQRATGSQPTSQPQPPHNVHPTRPSEHSTSTAQRYPIPKQLHQAASDRPTAVQGAPQRPSLAVQGVMSQPVLQKNSGYVLEGEGSSRVLSKKKLDELVRQVTGGTDSLTPEVEEVLIHPSSN